MLQGKIWRNDGELVFINDTYDLVDLMVRKVGYDAGQMLKKLIDLANETQQRIDKEVPDQI